MKTTKLLLIAFVFAAMAASSALAQTVTRTAGNWNHHRHYRSHSSVFFNFGLGYPYYGYGWGYPYGYGAYPYGYGYYTTPRYTTYPADRGYTDDATVAAVQRRLARGGYYHGSIDGVIGPGTRTAIRSFERNNGLPVDGVIDRELLRTMGLT
jgi:flavin-dependent dehydrogenase